MKNTSLCQLHKASDTCLACWRRWAPCLRLQCTQMQSGPVLGHGCQAVGILGLPRQCSNRRRSPLRGHGHEGERHEHSVYYCWQASPLLFAQPCILMYSSTPAAAQPYALMQSYPSLTRVQTTWTLAWQQVQNFASLQVSTLTLQFASLQVSTQVQTFASLQVFTLTLR